jgi:hypothetical protein
MNRLLFSGAVFFQDLNLNGATLEKSAAFRYSRFSHLADLQDVKLLGQLDFSNAIFFPFAKINVAGLAFDSERGKNCWVIKILSASSLLPFRKE